MSTIGDATLLGRRVDQWLSELAAAKRSPLTLDAYRGDLRAVGIHLGRHLGIEPADLDIRDITRPNLVAAFDSFSADHSPATIRRVMATFGSLCRYLVDATDDLPRNPVASIRRPDQPVRPRRIINDDDYPRKIISAAASGDERSRNRWPSRDVALMATYLLLGVRCSEAISIRPHDIVRMKDPMTVLIRGKRSNERLLVVPPLLLAMWDEYMVEASERFGPLAAQEPMFRSLAGNPMTRHNVASLVDRIYRQAGIRSDVPPGALVHSLRHGHATEAAYSGVPLNELRDHLGHATVAMTNLYLHSDPRRRRDLVENHPFVKQIQGVKASSD